MKLLELFSGTKSVGKVAEQLGYDVTSLDLKNADINTDILEWDYKQYPICYLTSYGHHHLVLNTVKRNPEVIEILNMLIK